ncbi:hypothetical protein ABIA94_003218 [Bradyrhizobium sp. LA7.1]
MIRSIETRLQKLEAVAVPRFTPWRRIIGNSAAECEVAMEAMIASGQAARSDRFGFRIIVSP